MPVFRASIIAADGRSYAANIDAPSLASLREIIRGRGEFLVSAAPRQSAKRTRNTKLDQKTLIQIFNLLAMQLSAGTGAVDAVAALKEEFPDRNARAVLREIYNALSASKATIAAAFGQFPRSFPAGMVATIAAGEQLGGEGLAERFADLRDYLKFRLRIRKTAVRATRYPAFLTLFAVSLAGFFVGKLVPQFKELFQALNTPLPAITRALLALSDQVTADWPLIATVLVAVVGAWIGARRIPTTAFRLDQLFLRLPHLGGIYTALVTAEVAKNFRALYTAGQPTTQTIRACAAIVTNRAVKASLIRAARLIETASIALPDGDQSQIITEALRSTGYFPTLALTVIKTGERAGKLADALENVATHYAEEASERIDVFFGVFQMTLFGLVAAFVGGGLVAFFIPIFTAVQHIK